MRKIKQLLLLSLAVLMGGGGVVAGFMTDREVVARNTFSAGSDWGKRMAGLEPAKLEVSYQEGEVSFVVNSVGGVNEINYTLTYLAVGGAQGIRGHRSVEDGRVEVVGLQLSTCSQGVCVRHEGVEEVSLMVELVGTGQILDKTLQITI